MVSTRWLLVWIVILCFGAIMVNAQESEPRTLVVFAASSLTDAFEDIGTEFEAQFEGVTVIYNFGGSSTLSAQIAEGAPADVFASANVPQMDVAVESGRVNAADVQIFARNCLVVALPVDNPAGITTLLDLANPGVLLVVAAPEVPIRTYTDTMFGLLASDPAYGRDYVEAVMRNIVSEEPNVRQVTARIALGEADAGVVYRSDVTPDIADDVIVLTIPDAYNVFASYPIAPLNDSRYPQLAAEFVDFVRSAAGAAILDSWGLVPVPPDETEVTPEATPDVDMTAEPDAEDQTQPLTTCR